MKHLLIFLSIGFLFSCKSNRFITEQNYNLSKSHQTIAVLPVNVITTGKLPNNVSEAELHEIEKAEAYYFQDLIVNAILRKQKNKRPLWVDFKSNQEVNAMLAEQNIGIDDLDNYSPTQLAELLQVDAVVLAKVNKERYMSETASQIIYGVDKVLDIATDGFSLPGFANRTYDIYLDLDVVDGASEKILYKRNVTVEIDFRDNSKDAVKVLSRRISRKFPYREYKY